MSANFIVLNGVSILNTYIVGNVFGPIGIPIINHPITINIQVMANREMVGISCFNVPNTVILFVSLLLYFSKKAIMTIKYMKNGVIPFPILSAALKINWVKSGVMLAFMNIGTKIGEAMVHFVMASGIKNDIRTIIINIVIISGIPVNSKLLMKLINHAAITSPRFVQLSTLINSDKKNISTKRYPRLLNSFDRPTLNSLVFLIFLEKCPYSPEQIIIMIKTMNTKALLNVDVSPRSWAT